MNKILNNQRSPADKAGIGCDKKVENICDRECMSSTKQMKFEEKIHFRYDSPLNNYNFPIYTIKMRVNPLNCFMCNRFGHIAEYCHTMRFYACDGFGIKSHYCKKIVNRQYRNIVYDINNNLWTGKEGIGHNIKKDVCK